MAYLGSFHGEHVVYYPPLNTGGQVKQSNVNRENKMINTQWTATMLTVQQSLESRSSFGFNDDDDDDNDNDNNNNNNNNNNTTKYELDA